MEHSLGDWVHTYIGWGLIVEVLNCNRYIVEFENGVNACFYGNQLTS